MENTPGRITKKVAAMSERSPMRNKKLNGYGALARTRPAEAVSMRSRNNPPSDIFWATFWFGFSFSTSFSPMIVYMSL